MKVLAPKRTLGSIRDLAKQIREVVKVQEDERFPVCKVVKVLDEAAIKDGRTFLEVGFEDEMGSAAGQTDQASGVITLRNDIYINLTNDGEEGRVTFVHELGHHLLHTGAPLYRVDPQIILSDIECAEAQADIFACEVLIDVEWLKKNIAKVKISDIARHFGLPLYLLEEHIERLVINGDIAEGIQLELCFEEPFQFSLLPFGNEALQESLGFLNE